jgi:hypothetical protein
MELEEENGTFILHHFCARVGKYRYCKQSRTVEIINLHWFQNKPVINKVCRVFAKYRIPDLLGRVIVKNWKNNKRSRCLVCNAKILFDTGKHRGKSPPHKIFNKKSGGKPVCTKHPFEHFAGYENLFKAFTLYLDQGKENET